MDGNELTSLTSDDVLSNMSSLAIGQISCHLNMMPRMQNESYEESFGHGTNDTTLYGCPWEWDNITCWPPTPPGEAVIVSCFEEFNGIRYDPTRNASRECLDTGEWNRSDYSNCIPLKPNEPSVNETTKLETTSSIYFVGYCLSLVALLLAIIIFVGFKELRCLRNTIHAHLIITYILADLCWIITNLTTRMEDDNISVVTSTLNNIGPDNIEATQSHHQISCITFMLLHYFHLTNFFWMFVEGLYLYVLVVQTFVAEVIKFRSYALIGWGIPLLVVVTWGIAKWVSATGSQELGMDVTENFHISTCLTESVYDWIYKSPFIFVLAVNSVFLAQIMWVLITKLRSATSPETQQSRKAAKALIVLMPLLGITNVLVLIGPSSVPLYEYSRALLISTQGLLVALLYCFLNGEVRVTLRHRWNRLMTLSNGWCQQCCRKWNNRPNQFHHPMRDYWSFSRSRTESLRVQMPCTISSMVPPSGIQAQRPSYCSQVPGEPPMLTGFSVPSTMTTPAPTPRKEGASLNIEL